MSEYNQGCTKHQNLGILKKGFFFSCPTIQLFCWGGLFHHKKVIPKVCGKARCCVVALMQLLHLTPLCLRYLCISENIWWVMSGPGLPLPQEIFFWRGGRLGFSWQCSYTQLKLGTWLLLVLIVGARTNWILLEIYISIKVLSGGGGSMFSSCILILNQTYTYWFHL